MSSKVVNRQIREHIRPLLKEAGFTAFSPRTSWRYGEEVVELVNFQSFNAYHAEVMGCTTFSFSINLGCFAAWLPAEGPVKTENGKLRPQEYDCQLRSSLAPGLPQPHDTPPGLWSIDAKGRNLDAIIHDAWEQIRTHGLPWLERLRDPYEILRTLQEDGESMEPGGAWGFGANPSPRRSAMIQAAQRRLAQG